MCLHQSHPGEPSQLSKCLGVIWKPLENMFLRDLPSIGMSSHHGLVEKFPIYFAIRTCQFLEVCSQRRIQWSLIVRRRISPVWLFSISLTFASSSQKITGHIVTSLSAICESFLRGSTDTQTSHVECTVYSFGLDNKRSAFVWPMRFD